MCSSGGGRLLSCISSQRDYAEKNSKRVVQHTTSVTVAETTLMIISISISNISRTGPGKQFDFYF